MITEALSFMLFSTIEAFAWVSLCMAIFRFKTSDYVYKILLVTLFMNLQSFILRNELSLSYLVPVINILFIAYLFTTIVRVSFIGSLTISAVGMASFALIQWLIATLFFGSMEAVETSVEYGYLVQLLSAIIVIPLGFFLYKFGYGFSYDFERFRLKHERLIVISSILTFLIIVTTVLYLKEIWSVIILLTVSLMFFLRYAVQKEREM
ncbi:hypothetical protein MKX41_10735 [Paenibacillus sp. FSL R5-0475]|uniref:hypothetical protein n=1 Tax=Paenibacillus sp. FSL R5-0475 TaxID=2921643 RepID=UPI0030F94710